MENTYSSNIYLRVRTCNFQDKQMLTYSILSMCQRADRFLPGSFPFHDFDQWNITLHTIKRLRQITHDANYIEHKYTEVSNINNFINNI